MKRLLAELKEYKAPSIKAPLFMIGEVGLELSLPFLMAYIIDNGVTKGDMKTVVIMGTAHAGSGVPVADLRRAVLPNMHHSLRLVLSRTCAARCLRTSSGSLSAMWTAIPQQGLVTRLMTDATNVQNAYMMILRMLVRAPMMLILAMVMTFAINAELAVNFLYAMLFLAVALTIITLLSYPVFRKVFRKYDDLNASVQENITNMRVVKAYVKEDAETEKFRGCVRHAV